MVSETFACEVLLWGCGYTSCQTPTIALGHVHERREELLAAEEDAQRRATYERVNAERDKLAAELAELYPAIEDKLAELLERIDSTTGRSNTSTSFVPLDGGADGRRDNGAAELYLMFSRRKLKGGDIGRDLGISPGRRCAERSSAVKKLVCEGTPDLIHEFLAFVAPD
jgi:hypothetical protein